MADALAIAEPPGDGDRWSRLTRTVVGSRGLAASLVLHAALLLALALWRAGLVPVPSEEAVDVQLLSSSELDALTDAAPEGAALPGPSAKPDEGLVKATRMLSAAALSDPLSRKGKAVYDTLNGTEQMVQLCDLEAMEQVEAWRPAFKPERIVAYAMADVKIAGDTIEADGATFRSDARWYNLKFTCGLSKDHATVIAFAFRVGAPVPQSELAAHDLIVDDGDAD